MEQALLHLLEDFNSGKLRAFSKSIARFVVYSQLEFKLSSWREYYELLLKILSLLKILNTVYKKFYRKNQKYLKKGIGSHF